MKAFFAIKASLAASLALASTAAFAADSVELNVRHTDCDAYDSGCITTVQRTCDSAQSAAMSRLAMLATADKTVDTKMFDIRSNLVLHDDIRCYPTRFGHSCYRYASQDCVLSVRTTGNYDLKLMSWSQKGREDVCKPILDGYRATANILFSTFGKHIAGSRFDSPSKCWGTNLVVDKQ